MLAVAGGKGGTGTTTTTLGLAAALAGQRRRPLAVDADAGTPDLALLAGLDADDAGRSGVDRVAAGEPVADAAVVAAQFPGVDVLPAGPGDDVSGALVRLADSRPVLVDCPSGGGRSAAVPLRVADAAVVVTTARRQAVEDALKTAAMARAVDTPPAALVVSRGDGVPPALRSAVDAPAVAVPAADGDPLADAAVRAAHDRLAGRLSRRGEPVTAVRSAPTADSQRSRASDAVGTGGNRRERSRWRAGGRQHSNPDHVSAAAERFK
jgi:septum site-determining protein MinD